MIDGTLANAYLGLRVVLRVLGWGLDLQCFFTAIYRRHWGLGAVVTPPLLSVRAFYLHSFSCHVSYLFRAKLPRPQILEKVLRRYFQKRIVQEVVIEARMLMLIFLAFG